MSPKELFQNPCRRAWVPLTFFTLFALLQVLHKILRHVARTPYWGSYIQVLDEAARRAFENTGRFPLWEETLLGGMSYLVNMPFPFSISRLLTMSGAPALLALFVSEAVFTVVGSVCFYCLLRRSTGLSCAVFATVLFQLWLYKWQIHESYPMALAPVVFLCSEKFVESGRRVFVLLSSLTITLACLCGVIHGIAYVFLFHTFYVLLKISSDRRKGLAHAKAYSISWGLGLALALPLLLPQAKLNTTSYRALRENFTFGLLGSQTVIERFIEAMQFELRTTAAFTPSLILPYLMLPVACPLLFRNLCWRPLCLATLAVLFVHLLIAFTQGNWNHIPIVGRIVNALDVNRGICALGFGLCWVSGVFVQTQLVSVMKRKRYWLFWVGIEGVLVAFLFHWDKSILVAAILTMAFFWFLSGTEIDKTVKERVVGVLAGILLFFSVDYNNLRSSVLHWRSLLNGVGWFHVDALLPGERPDIGQKIIEKIRQTCGHPHRCRVVDSGTPKHSELVYIANGIRTLFGLTNLYPGRYHAFFGWLIHDLKGASSAEYEQFVKWGSYCSSFGSRFNENLLSLAGVRWIIARNEMKEHRFSRVIKGEQFSLYENRDVFPRVFPAFKIREFVTFKALETHMLRAKASDLRKEVPMLRSELEKAKTPIQFRLGLANIRPVHWASDRIDLDVEYSEDGLLVLTDTFDYGWRARIDAKEAHILPAYDTFRAVVVPRGRHSVEFEYRYFLF